MPGTLDDYRKSSVAAEESLFFLGLPTGSQGAEELHMLFLRSDASSIDTGVNTEDVADVTQKTQPSEITSYSPTQSLSGLFLKDDPCCQALEKLFRDRAVGEDTYFSLVEVDYWKEHSSSTTESPAWVAYKTQVSIEVTSLTNEAGGKRRIEATIHYTGDPVSGKTTAKPTTAGIVTFTADT